MKRWTEQYRKAVTFSYDDGVEQDEHLVAMLNRYHVKATFNLNSGMDPDTGTWRYKNLTVRHLDPNCWKQFYAGHEAACHTVHHYNLYETEDAALIREEIACDKAAIEGLLGKKVYGMAYPFGGYTPLVQKIAAEEGIRYARGTHSTHSFAVQKDLMAFAPTCHHEEEDLFDLAERFVRSTPEEPAIFYIWGHSYEFEANHNWDRMECLLRQIAGRADIFYGTNAEVLLGIGR